MALRAAAHVVQVRMRAGVRDPAAEHARAAAQSLGWDCGPLAVSRLYAVDLPMPREWLADAAQKALACAVTEEVAIDQLQGAAGSHLLLGRLPGVTDDEGRTAQAALSAVLGRADRGDTQHVFALRLLAFERRLTPEQLRSLGAVLANPLVDRIEAGDGLPAQVLVADFAPAVAHAQATVTLDGSDAELLAISKDRTLHLNLAEMRAVRDHFRAVAAERLAAAMPAEPTDCELEIFAQTWSEHCKHKEFAATIAFEHNGEAKTVHSLFKTFIRGATERIRAKYAQIGEDWMLTVFSDNAGVVELDDNSLFVLKVETHNSPSALDPVGGAMTGVLGNNRDAFGTGKGGARLLFNTNVLCFGPPDYSKPLLRGQMHPQRIALGVIDGIKQAGNKSGVPTVNGAILFDDRFAGKPLVYCGTGAILPRHYAGSEAWTKRIEPGYRVVVVGGRVGRDGIHGATFSSGELTDQVSGSVVQIGSPIVQKGVNDFMQAACALGLVAAATDNGAGGLSSSVGELAQTSGGARIDVGLVPLKYAGLQPWEILLSESQERMTLAIEPAALSELLALAARLEVEATDIGAFDDSGRLHVTFGQTTLAHLDLHFLHHGVPPKHMVARWTDPAPLPLPAAELDYGQTILQLLASPNICSRQPVIRQYDHEVKGKTVVKPLMGRSGTGPQDAAVMRASFDGWHGVAIASGICPKYGDLDPYHMAAGAFDEAVRSLISVGARLPQPGEAPSWSACDNFCVPDSALDPAGNPDGDTKLGKLVRMCEALYDMSVFFDVPMTSGKDSMKNDFRADGQKISVPPTVLFTMVARMTDVRRAVTSDFKQAGDSIFVVGHSYDELGGSELARMHEWQGGQVPLVRQEQAKRVYEKMMAAHAQGLLASSHDCSDGGMAIALAECCIGGGLGALVALPIWPDVGALAMLFGESHSRFVVSVAPENVGAFEAALGSDARFAGLVAEAPVLTMSVDTGAPFSVALGELDQAFHTAVL